MRAAGDRWHNSAQRWAGVAAAPPPHRGHTPPHPRHTAAAPPPHPRHTAAARHRTAAAVRPHRRRLPPRSRRARHSSTAPREAPASLVWRKELDRASRTDYTESMIARDDELFDPDNCPERLVQHDHPADVHRELRHVRRAPQNPRPRPQPNRALERLFERHHGIVATRELREGLGDWPGMIPMLRDYGLVVPLRQGWYGAPWLPADADIAWRCGGSLACVSALEFHGELAKPLDVPWGIGAARPLHICVPSTTPRITAPWMLVPRGARYRPLRPVVHWSTRDARSGDRRAVSIPIARAQAARCLAA